MFGLFKVTFVLNEFYAAMRIKTKKEKEFALPFNIL